MNLSSRKRKFSHIILALLISTALLVNLSAATLQSKSSDDAKDETTNVTYDLLIISPKKFSRYLILLVEHKNNHEVKTIQVNTEEIYQQLFLEGKDEAEKIKYFIKAAIENWEIKYVLLVGGRKGQGYKEKWWVPVRYTYLNRNYEKYSEGKFLTDLYFADIYDAEGNFSSWDTNNNGIFGEWPKNSSAADIPDLYPDVCVGRLPCRNVFDVKIIVNKIIKYETGSFDDSWFKKMVVVAGDTYPKKTPGFIDGEIHTQRALENMTDFTPVKLYTSDGSLKNWVDIVRAINKGCGFVFFSGHGGPHLWLNNFPGTKNKTASIHLRHMNFLINKNKLPVCLSASGCFNNMFNVSLTHSEWVYWNGLILQGIKYNIARCWGETLTFKPFGGCIAVIASTAFSYESSDISRREGGCEWLDINFFEQYGVNNIDTLGECWGATVSAFLQNFTIDWNDTSSTGSALIAKNLEQWLLIGDPSLKIGGYSI